MTEYIKPDSTFNNDIKSVSFTTKIMSKNDSIAYCNFYGVPVIGPYQKKIDKKYHTKTATFDERFCREYLDGVLKAVYYVLHDGSVWRPTDDNR